MADNDWMWEWVETPADFGRLAGLPLQEVGALQVTSYGDSTPVVLIKAGGRWFAQTHRQDCCELVEPVDPPSLASSTRGAVIRHAEERTEATETGSSSETWTFYEVRTDAEDFTIRWVGRSNGYYSERVDFRAAPDGWEPPAGLVSWFADG